MTVNTDVNKDVNNIITLSFPLTFCVQEVTNKGQLCFVEKSQLYLM